MIIILIKCLCRRPLTALLICINQIGQKSYKQNDKGHYYYHFVYHSSSPPLNTQFSNPNTSSNIIQYSSMLYSHSLQLSITIYTSLKRLHALSLHLTLSLVPSLCVQIPSSVCKCSL